MFSKYTYNGAGYCLAGTVRQYLCCVRNICIFQSYINNALLITRIDLHEKDSHMALLTTGAHPSAAPIPVLST